EDKKLRPISRREDRVFDVLNPAVRTQFYCADQRVHGEEHEQQRRADCPAACATEHQEHHAATRCGEIEPSGTGTGHVWCIAEEFAAGESAQERPKTVLEKQENKKADDCRTKDAHLAEHLTKL